MKVYLSSTGEPGAAVAGAVELALSNAFPAIAELVPSDRLAVVDAATLRQYLPIDAAVICRTHSDESAPELVSGYAALLASGDAVGHIFQLALYADSKDLASGPALGASSSFVGTEQGLRSLVGAIGEAQGLSVAAGADFSTPADALSCARRNAEIRRKRRLRMAAGGCAAAIVGGLLVGSSLDFPSEIGFPLGVVGLVVALLAGKARWSWADLPGYWLASASVGWGLGDVGDLWAGLGGALLGFGSAAVIISKVLSDPVDPAMKAPSQQLVGVIAGLLVPFATALVVIFALMVR